MGHSEKTEIQHKCRSCAGTADYREVALHLNDKTSEPQGNSYMVSNVEQDNDCEHTNVQCSTAHSYTLAKTDAEKPLNAPVRTINILNAEAPSCVQVIGAGIYPRDNHHVPAEDSTSYPSNKTCGRCVFRLLLDHDLFDDFLWDKSAVSSNKSVSSLYSGDKFLLNRRQTPGDDLSSVFCKHALIFLSRLQSEYRSSHQSNKINCSRNLDKNVTNSAVDMNTGTLSKSSLQLNTFSLSNNGRGHQPPNAASLYSNAERMRSLSDQHRFLSMYKKHRSENQLSRTCSTRTNCIESEQDVIHSVQQERHFQSCFNTRSSCTRQYSSSHIQRTQCAHEKHGLAEYDLTSILDSVMTISAPSNDKYGNSANALHYTPPTEKVPGNTSTYSEKCLHETSRQQRITFRQCSAARDSDQNFRTFTLPGITSGDQSGSQIANDRHNSGTKGSEFDWLPTCGHPMSKQKQQNTLVSLNDCSNELKVLIRSTIKDMEKCKSNVSSPTSTRMDHRRQHASLVPSEYGHTSNVFHKQSISLGAFVNTYVDVPADTRLDAPIDTRLHTLIDTSMNAPIDTSINASIDTSLDARIGTQTGAAVDRSLDTSIYTSLDARIGTRAGAAVDRSLDTSIDTRRLYTRETDKRTKCSNYPEGNNHFPFFISSRQQDRRLDQCDLLRKPEEQSSIPKLPAALKWSYQRKQQIPSRDESLAEDCSSRTDFCMHLGLSDLDALDNRQGACNYYTSKVANNSKRSKLRRNVFRAHHTPIRSDSQENRLYMDERINVIEGHKPRVLLKIVEPFEEYIGNCIQSSKNVQVMDTIGNSINTAQKTSIDAFRTDVVRGCVEKNREENVKDTVWKQGSNYKLSNTNNMCPEIQNNQSPISLGQFPQISNGIHFSHSKTRCNASPKTFGAANIADYLHRKYGKTLAINDKSVCKLLNIVKSRFRNANLTRDISITPREVEDGQRYSRNDSEISTLDEARFHEFKSNYAEIIDHKNNSKDDSIEGTQNSRTVQSLHYQPNADHWSVCRYQNLKDHKTDDQLHVDKKNESIGKSSLTGDTGPNEDARHVSEVSRKMKICATNSIANNGLNNRIKLSKNMKSVTTNPREKVLFMSQQPHVIQETTVNEKGENKLRSIKQRTNKWQYKRSTVSVAENLNNQSILSDSDTSSDLDLACPNVQSRFSSSSNFKRASSLSVSLPGVSGQEHRDFNVSRGQDNQYDVEEIPYLTQQRKLQYQIDQKILLDEIKQRPWDDTKVKLLQQFLSISKQSELLESTIRRPQIEHPLETTQNEYDDSLSSPTLSHVVDTPVRKDSNQLQLSSILKRTECTDWMDENTCLTDTQNDSCYERPRLPGEIYIPGTVSMGLKDNTCSRSSVETIEVSGSKIIVLAFNKSFSDKSTINSVATQTRSLASLYMAEELVSRTELESFDGSYYREQHGDTLGPDNSKIMLVKLTTPSGQPHIVRYLNEYDDINQLPTALRFNALSHQTAARHGDTQINQLPTTSRFNAPSHQTSARPWDTPINQLPTTSRFNAPSHQTAARLGDTPINQLPTTSRLNAPSHQTAARLGDTQLPTTSRFNAPSHQTAARLGDTQINQLPTTSRFNAPSHQTAARPGNTQIVPGEYQLIKSPPLQMDTLPNLSPASCTFLEMTGNQDWTFKTEKQYDESNERGVDNSRNITNNDTLTSQDSVVLRDNVPESFYHSEDPHYLDSTPRQNTDYNPKSVQQSCPFHRSSDVNMADSDYLKYLTPEAEEKFHQFCLNKHPVQLNGSPPSIQLEGEQVSYMEILPKSGKSRGLRLTELDDIRVTKTLDTHKVHVLEDAQNVHWPYNQKKLPAASVSNPISPRLHSSSSWSNYSYISSEKTSDSRNDDQWGKSSFVHENDFCNRLFLTNEPMVKVTRFDPKQVHQSFSRWKISEPNEIINIDEMASIEDTGCPFKWCDRKPAPRISISKQRNKMNMQGRKKCLRNNYKKDEEKKNYNHILNKTFHVSPSMENRNDMHLQSDKTSATDAGNCYPVITYDNYGHVSKQIQAIDSITCMESDSNTMSVIPWNPDYYSKNVDTDYHVHKYRKPTEKQRNIPDLRSEYMSANEQDVITEPRNTCTCENYIKIAPEETISDDITQEELNSNSRSFSNLIFESIYRTDHSSELHDTDRMRCVENTHPQNVYHTQFLQKPSKTLKPNKQTVDPLEMEARQPKFTNSKQQDRNKTVNFVQDQLNVENIHGTSKHSCKTATTASKRNMKKYSCMKVKASGMSSNNKCIHENRKANITFSHQCRPTVHRAVKNVERQASVKFKTSSPLSYKYNRRGLGAISANKHSPRGKKREKSLVSFCIRPEAPSKSYRVYTSPDKKNIFSKSVNKTSPPKSIQCKGRQARQIKTRRLRTYGRPVFDHKDNSRTMSIHPSGLYRRNLTSSSPTRLFRNYTLAKTSPKSRTRRNGSIDRTCTNYLRFMGNTGRTKTRPELVHNFSRRLNSPANHLFAHSHNCKLPNTRKPNILRNFGKAGQRSQFSSSSSKNFGYKTNQNLAYTPILKHTPSCNSVLSCHECVHQKKHTQVEKRKQHTDFDMYGHKDISYSHNVQEQQGKYMMNGNCGLSKVGQRNYSTQVRKLKEMNFSSVIQEKPEHSGACNRKAVVSRNINSKNHKLQVMRTTEQYPSHKSECVKSKYANVVGSEHQKVTLSGSDAKGQPVPSDARKRVQFGTHVCDTDVLMGDQGAHIGDQGAHIGDQGTRRCDQGTRRVDHRSNIVFQNYKINKKSSRAVSPKDTHNFLHFPSVLKNRLPDGNNLELSMDSKPQCTNVNSLSQNLTSPPLICVKTTIDGKKLQRASRIEALQKSRHSYQRKYSPVNRVKTVVPKVYRFGENNSRLQTSFPKTSPVAKNTKRREATLARAQDRTSPSNIGKSNAGKHAQAWNTNEAPLLDPCHVNMTVFPLFQKFFARETVTQNPHIPISPNIETLEVTSDSIADTLSTFHNTTDDFSASAIFDNPSSIINIPRTSQTLKKDQYSYQQLAKQKSQQKPQKPPHNCHSTTAFHQIINQHKNMHASTANNTALNYQPQCEMLDKSQPGQHIRRRHKLYH